MSEITLNQLIADVGVQTSVLVLTAFAAFAIVRQLLSERRIEMRIKEKSDLLKLSVEKNLVEGENKALERERVLSERLISLTQKYGELQSLNATMKAELATASTRLSNATEAARLLEIKVSALQQGHIENERKIAEMMLAADKLARERDILRDDNNAKAERINELEKRVSTLERDNARLKDELKALKDESKTVLKLTDKQIE